MTIDRMDLDGFGSPIALAARIHELLPDLPLPVPLKSLCEQLDVTSIKPLTTDAFEAALITDEHKAEGAIVYARGRSTARTRFSIAHELGHFLIPSHRPAADGPTHCTLDNLRMIDAREKDEQRQVEAEANRFAAHLLMPPKRLRTEILKSDTTLQAIVALSERFGVSKEAMARMWVAQHPEPVAIIISRYNRIERYYRGDDFPWLATNPGAAVPTGSTADGLALAVGSYSEIDEIEPDVWIGDRAARNVLALDEQVLAQQSGFAMILLIADLDDE